MTTTSDGGPAFPVQKNNILTGGTFAEAYGMSLRDWFAGQALAGLCAANTITASTMEEAHAHAAKAAISLADAMLAERANRGEKP